MQGKKVASFTDAWIETYFRSRERYLKTVASFTDAWIETDQARACAFSSLSHLLQMRGLKPLAALRKNSCARRIFYRCVD